METIAQRDLRNGSGEILRRVEAGERFVVTMAGRPVAELIPVSHRSRALTDQQVDAILKRNVPDDGMLDDLRALPAELGSGGALGA